MKPRKPYAFVSYSVSAEASVAMDMLQGHEVEGVGLVSDSPGVKLYLSYVESGELKVDDALKI